jgi:outer membrane lipoprotein SlyB
VPTKSSPSRSVWLLAGVLGAASIAAGASLLARNPGSSAPPAATAPAPSREAAAAPEPKPAGSPARAVTTSPAATPAAARAAQPAVCRDCGVVESARTVTRKGEGSGAGAVAGGVLGAVVGNQFGKGGGRKAMTVLGAVGGGVAGHEVERCVRSTTVQEVKVRMDDGTLRTFEQAQALRTGERVTVEGGRLRPLAAAGASKG